MKSILKNYLDWLHSFTVKSVVDTYKSVLESSLRVIINNSTAFMIDYAGMDCSAVELETVSRILR